MYEDKFIAFVDILGFSDLVLRSENGGDDAPTVEYLIDLTKMLGSSKEREHFAKYGPTVCPCAPYNARDLSFRVTQISDCVVVSAEVSPAGLINLMQHCFGISMKLLIAGHLCRGYITRGKIFHTDTQFFGTGYIRAYNNERKVSIFRVNGLEEGTPFIEIHPEVRTYVADQPDACVKTVFGRMTETDGHSTAISPFPALKRIPATVIDKNFDPVRWKAQVQIARENRSRLLSQLEKAEATLELADAVAATRARTKIEHYKRKIREVLACKDEEIEMLDRLSQLVPIQAVLWMTAPRSRGDSLKTREFAGAAPACHREA
jgi:hypothetical protein